MWISLRIYNFDHATSQKHFNAVFKVRVITWSNMVVCQDSNNSWWQHIHMKWKHLKIIARALTGHIWRTHCPFNYLCQQWTKSPPGGGGGRRPPMSVADSCSLFPRAHSRPWDCAWCFGGALAIPQADRLNTHSSEIQKGGGRVQ